MIVRVHLIVRPWMLYVNDVAFVSTVCLARIPCRLNLSCDLWMRRPREDKENMKNTLNFPSIYLYSEVSEVKYQWQHKKLNSCATNTWNSSLSYVLICCLIFAISLSFHSERKKCALHFLETKWGKELEMKTNETERKRRRETFDLCGNV